MRNWFQIKIKITYWKMIWNQNHSSKIWFQIVISNRLISNRTQHCPGAEQSITQRIRDFLTMRCINSLLLTYLLIYLLTYFYLLVDASVNLHTKQSETLSFLVRYLETHVFNVIFTYWKHLSLDYIRPADAQSILIPPKTLRSSFQRQSVTPLINIDELICPQSGESGSHLRDSDCSRSWAEHHFFILYSFLLTNWTLWHHLSVLSMLNDVHSACGRSLQDGIWGLVAATILKFN